LAHLDKTEGKLNKFFKEKTLLNQPFVKDNTQTVKSYLDSINKGLTVDSFKRVSIGRVGQHLMKLSKLDGVSYSAATSLIK